MLNNRDAVALRPYSLRVCRTAFTVVHDIPPLKKAEGCEAADWGLRGQAPAPSGKTPRPPYGASP